MSKKTSPMDLDDIQKCVYSNLLEKFELAKKLNIIDGNVTYLDPHAEGLRGAEKFAITSECINNLAYLEHHFKTPDIKRNISGVLNSLIIEMLFRSDRRESQAFQYIVRELLQISFNEDGDFEPSLKQQIYNLRGTYGAFATPSKLYNECGISIDMVSLKKKFYKQKDPYMKVSPLLKCLITRLPKKD